MIESKGSIYILAGEVGALMAKADERMIEKIKEYCHWLSLGYQIKDDIIDVIGSIETSGKPIGQDVNKYRM